MKPRKDVTLQLILAPGGEVIDASAASPKEVSRRIRRANHLWAEGLKDKALREVRKRRK